MNARPDFDPARLRDLYLAHAAPVFLYARTWLNPHDADDAVQEAFTRLFTQPAEPREPRAWLFRVVRNLAATSHRKRARRAAQPLHGDPLLFTPRPDSLVSLPDVQAVIAGLSENDREIVVLRIWGGMTFEQIAELTTTPLTSVYRSYRSSLEHARTRLEIACRKTHH